MTMSFSSVSFVAGVLVGVLATGAWFYRDDAGFLPPSSTVARTGSGADTLIESGAISVRDQNAGAEVLVDSVTVPAPAVWVAVRETSDGVLGNVLGAIRVAGPRSELTVPLLRDTILGQTYAVQIYRDDAGGVFDPSKNSVYVDFDTGAPVIARFSTAW